VELTLKWVSRISVVLVAALFTAGLSAQEGPAPGMGFDNGQFDKLLKLKLWVVRTVPAQGAEVPAFNPGQPGAGPVRNEMGMTHAEYQRYLESSGILFAAGPYFDAKGNQDGGMIVIRANSEEEARKIADGDPNHISGMRTYTLHQWMINEGQMRVVVDFSTGEYQFE